MGVEIFSGPVTARPDAAQAEDEPIRYERDKSQTSLASSIISKESKRPLRRISQSLGFFLEGGVDADSPLIIHAATRVSRGVRRGTDKKDPNENMTTLCLSTRKGYPHIAICQYGCTLRVDGAQIQR